MKNQILSIFQEFLILLIGLNGRLIHLSNVKISAHRFPKSTLKSNVSHVKLSCMYHEKARLLPIIQFICWIDMIGVDTGSSLIAEIANLHKFLSLEFHLILITKVPGSFSQYYSLGYIISSL